MNKEANKHVFVAMSGGVDSSVAALLLRNQGYQVTGIFMRCYNLDGCAEQDAMDARRVAEKLQIPFYVWDFEAEYKEKVVDYMVEGYRRGITPNPDVMCNKKIKFGLFFEKALATGAAYVATGHYVRLATSQWGIGCRKNLNSKLPHPSGYTLVAAKDAQKDQSYFLWTLTQEKLRRCLFPIGDYLKSEVRDMARKAGLSTAEKKDSQGICFLGRVKLDDFLRTYIPEKRGVVLATTGEKVGEHTGAHYYTIGQRHIGMANRGRTQIHPAPSMERRGKKDFEPLYITEKDVVTNTVVVAEGNNNPALYKKEVEVNDLNFISPHVYSLIRANRRIGVMARVRYRQPLTQAVLENNQIPNSKFQKLRLIFDKPVKFVAPGQSAVFYSTSGELLGGGVIL